MSSSRMSGGGDGEGEEYSFSIVPNKGEKEIRGMDTSEDEQFDQSLYQNSFIQSNNQTTFRNQQGADEFTSLHQLHNAFSIALFNMPSRLQLFEVMDEWMIYIEKALNIHRHFNSEMSEEVHNKLHKILKMEYETWDLIKTLYFERLNVADEAEQPIPFNEPIDDKFHFDDLTYATSILQGSKSLREMDLIINWLELNYSRQGDPDLSSKIIAWEQTLDMLKRNELLGRASSSIVSHIDPDATTREQKELHPLDADEENRILRGTFHYLRTGSIEKAVAFLHQSGHIGKAKALLGSLMSQKEVISADELPEDDFVVLPRAQRPGRSSEAEQQEPVVVRRERLNFDVTGNPMRHLWKNIAWSICEQDGVTSKWERAIIGTCCAHRKSMLEVSTTWEDKLWSHLKSAVNVQIEEKLRGLNRNAQNVELSQEYWSQGLNITEILSNLETSEKKEFTVENMFQFLQKCVMENKVDLFLEELATNIEDLFMNADDPTIMNHLTRFLAHLLLTFAISELGYHDKLTDLVCDAYVNVMVKNGLFAGIPFYVQKLSTELQIPVIVSQVKPETHYSLEEIKDFLQGCFESCLDVLGIAVAIVDKLREEVSEFNVDMLQWISCCLDLVENQSAVMYEYLRFTVWVSRKYLTLGNTEKVKGLVKQITQECIATVEKVSPTLVREFVCYREYLEAEDALSLWKQAKIQRPLMDQVIPEFYKQHSSLTDKALYDKKRVDLENREKQWETAVLFHGKGAIDAFMKILKFPDGGWLRGCSNNAEEVEVVHINSVRRIIMKKIVFLLLNLVKDRKDIETFQEFIYVLCDHRRRILEDFFPAEIGSIFKVVEEFHRTNNPSLSTHPVS